MPMSIHGKELLVLGIPLYFSNSYQNINHSDNVSTSENLVLHLSAACSNTLHDHLCNWCTFQFFDHSQAYLWYCYFYIQETKVLQPEFPSSQNVTHNKFFFRDITCFFLDIRSDMYVHYFISQWSWNLLYFANNIAQKVMRFCRGIWLLQSRVEI